MAAVFRRQRFGAGYIKGPPPFFVSQFAGLQALGN